MLTLKKKPRKLRTFADHGWYALLLLLSLILLSVVTSCQREEVQNIRGQVSTCMVGKAVEVTCLSEVAATGSDS